MSINNLLISLRGFCIKFEDEVVQTKKLLIKKKEDKTMKLIRLNNEPTFSDLLNSFFENDPANLFSRNHCNVPATNIVENEKSYELELAVPGMNKEDFRIDIENNTLTISSEKNEEKEETTKNYTRKEFVYGSFSRSFVLPKNIDTEKIKAEYKNGVLCMALPKKEEDKTNLKRVIEIN